MKLNKMHLAILALIISNTIWGASAPILKWTLENIHPFTLAFMRFTIAALVLFPFCAHKLIIRKKDWMTLIYASTIGMAFHVAYMYAGLQLSSSINLPIILSAAPIFLILGSILFLHEKPQKKVIKGTIISLMGILFIVFRPLFEQSGHDSIIGNIFFIVGMCLDVSYTLLLKEIAYKYNPIALTFWIMAISSVFLTPFVLYEAMNTPVLFTMNQGTVIGILYSGLLSSALGYLLYTYGMKYISANETGIFLYIDPIVAVLIAIPLLGETPTLTFMIGAILVFLGIFVSENRIHYHPIHLFFKKRDLEQLPNSTILPEKIPLPDPNILTQENH